MTTEQREHKLNKRIAIFEQAMNYQIGVLHVKYSFDLIKKQSGLTVAMSAKTQACIIQSQPLPPKFQSSGYA